MTPDKLEKLIAQTRKRMEKAAKEMDFMEAARLRDEVFSLEALLSSRQAEKGKKEK